MKKQPSYVVLPLFFLLFWSTLAVTMMAKAQESNTAATFTVTGDGMVYTEQIPVFDGRAFSQRTMTTAAMETSTSEQGGGSDPTNPYAAIRKSASAYAAPETAVRYAITLANYESITRTYQLTETLPATVAYVEYATRSSGISRTQNDELVYNAATRTLTWQGALAPAQLDYLIEDSDISLPYLDLAAYGAPNLCDPFFANEEPCKDVAVTFNLGINGYTAVLYGEPVSQLTVSSNGLLLGGDTTADGDNQWLPTATAPNFLLAGLWRDVDMGTVESNNGYFDTAQHRHFDTAQYGRFHAAIIAGLIDGQDVFYAQWHDAPAAGDSNITARHAIAVVLASTSSAQAPSTSSAQAPSTSSAQTYATDMSTSSSLTGHAFYIYDNISDPAQIATAGYSIGIEDKLGVRGVTYAYAPCCGNPQPPQGYPPTAGTTLHLRPVLFGADNAYSRTFSYEAVVNGTVPETVATTVFASSDSDDPALSFVWSTHYLHVRWQTYLPLLINGEG